MKVFEPIPVITSISPPGRFSYYVDPNVERQITINGARFDAAAVVSCGGRVCRVLSRTGSTQIVIVQPPAPDSGNNPQWSDNLRVRNPDGLLAEHPVVFDMNVGALG